MSAAPAGADDGSDGNESLSAPSEFLAEFLSAIMRRQYAEALKYCRLILQYEPHNATARGFYPLLRHKLTHKHPPTEGEPEVSASEQDNESPPHVPSHNEAMDHSADVSLEDEDEGGGGGGSGSGSEYASSPSELELDSDPETDTRDRTDRTDSTGSGPGSRWDSSGSSPRDDNGNTQTGACPGGDTSDLENDNAPHLDNKPDHSSETESWASLRRLRARFAAIK